MNSYVNNILAAILRIDGKYIRTILNSWGEIAANMEYSPATTSGKQKYWPVNERVCQLCHIRRFGGVHIHTFNCINKVFELTELGDGNSYENFRVFVTGHSRSPLLVERLAWCFN